MALYRITRLLVAGLAAVLFRVRVVGREHVPTSGVYVVAAPHRSLLDVPFVALITPRRLNFLAKAELFSIPVLGRVFRALGGIAVDRGTVDRAALRSLGAVLDGGEPVAIFPEGTRCEGPELSELYDGTAYLALKHGVPVLPVGVGGSEQVLGRDRRVPRLHRVAVVVGPALVPPPTMSVRRRADISVFTRQLEAALQARFDEARRLAGAP